MVAYYSIRDCRPPVYPGERAHYEYTTARFTYTVSLIMTSGGFSSGIVRRIGDQRVWLDSQSNDHTYSTPAEAWTRAASWIDGYEAAEAACAGS